MFKITLNQKLSHLVWDNVLWLPGVAPLMTAFLLLVFSHPLLHSPMNFGTQLPESESRISNPKYALKRRTF